MINFDKTISTNKVLLRPIMSEDYAAMEPLTRDSKMWYYFTEQLSDKRILHEWIMRAVEELEQRRSLPFTIIDATNGKIIGTTRISNISEFHSRVEIGWTWIAKTYHGTGINGHVKRLLFDYLFNETKTQRIEFKTDVLNIAARKAMQKVGLVEEGILRSHTLMTNERRRDTIYYSILKDEWVKMQ